MAMKLHCDCTYIRISRFLILYAISSLSRFHFDPILAKSYWYCDNATLCKTLIRSIIVLHSRAWWALSSIFSDIFQIISHQFFENQYLHVVNMTYLTLHSIDLNEIHYILRNSPSNTKLWKSPFDVQIISLSTYKSSLSNSTYMPYYKY